MVNLTRPVTRRIGKLVVTITPEGLILRRYRCRRAKTIVWAELGASTNPPRTAAEAFIRRLPRGWVPNLAEPVYFRNKHGDNQHLGHGVICGILAAVPDPIFQVRSARKRVRQFLLHDLRPKE